MKTKLRCGARQAEVARLQQAMAQWKDAAEKAALAAKAVAAQRDKATLAAVTSERRAEDLSSKNAELFRLGSEILDRYEKFGLGAQFLAREPFVGRARIELENQIQDFDDQLLAQKDNP